MSEHEATAPSERPTEVDVSKLETALSAAEQRVQVKIEDLRRNAYGEAVEALVASALPPGMPDLHWGCTVLPGRDPVVHAFPVCRAAAFSAADARAAAADFAAWVHHFGGGYETSLACDGRYTQFVAWLPLSGLRVRLSMTAYHRRDLTRETAHRIVAAAVEAASGGEVAT